jgi:signal transduction histidine kinase
VLRQLAETSAALSETLLSNLVPLEILNSLKAHERHALRQSINEGADISVIDASFDVADFDREFQKLKEKLISEGEVIAVAPQVESERPQKIKFRILYASTTFLTLDKIVERAVRAGRAAAAALGKEVQFATDGTDLSINQSICNVIAHPVLHLVRNAVDHGIEQRGKITITAEEHDDQLRIRVTDDGRGIDPSVMSLIFQPGFSTRNEVSEISGRGVGLDAVKTTIEAVGGSISVSSELGKGSTFQIRVPNPR